MPRLLRAAILLVTADLSLLVLTACPSEAPSAPGGGAAGPCTLTASGAVSASQSCGTSQYRAAFSASKGSFGLILTSPPGTVAPLINVAVEFPGEAHTGHFSSSDPGAAGGATITQNIAAWIASTGSTTQGVFFLNLSSVAAPISTNDGKAYEVHGNFTATLPAIMSSGANGTVTLIATF
jgi:hypothetical protein